MSEHHDDLAHDHDQDHGHGEAAAMTDPMAPGETFHVDVFEAAWIRISAVVVAIFIIALAVSGFAVGIQVPGAYARITPDELADPNSPFANPGLKELAPGKYEAYIVGQTWNFVPAEIRVPVGSEVTFYITARDVQHGFKLLDTNVNMMVLPGQVSTLKAVFDTPGTFNYICHEYCGYVEGSPIGHHTMYGQLIVEGGEEEATQETAAAVAD